MKKLSALLLALLLLLSTLPAVSLAQEEPFVINIMTSEHAKYPIDTESQPVFKWIEEAAGVKLVIEAVPSANYAEKKATRLVTGNLPDVLRVSQSDLNEYARLGAFVNLSDYEELMPNYLAARATVDLIQYTEVEGSIYSFNKIGYECVRGLNGPAIRTDLLEKHGLAVPASYEELAVVLEKLKELYPASYPWSARGTGSFIRSLAYGFGTTWGLEFDVDKDCYVYGYLTPEMKVLITYLNDLYTKGILDPDFYTNSDASLSAEVASESCLFMMNNVNFLDDYNAAVQITDPNARFEMIPTLKNETTGAYRILGQSFQSQVGASFAISAKAKNVEKIISFFDWLYSPEGAAITNFGIEGETYEMVNGQPEFTDAILRETKSASDTVKEVEYGLTHNIMALYHSQRQWYANNYDYMNQPMFRRSVTIANDEHVLVPPAVGPVLSEEALEEYTDIANKVNTLADENIIKFILGERPMSEFDSFVETLKNAGAERMVEIYNTAFGK